MNGLRPNDIVILRRQMDRRWCVHTVRRFLQYCLVGGSGVVVDMALFYGMADPTCLGWNPSLSKLVAAEIAMINNFLWNELWTFRDQEALASTTRRRWIRFLMFNLVCAAGVGISLCVLYFLYRLVDLNLHLANLVAIVAATLWNFWMNYRYSWARRNTTNDPERGSNSIFHLYL